MSDTFLPGNGFDTYESQDKVLIQMADTAACAVAVRILQQQGFAVAGAAVRLAAEQAAEAEAAKQAAEKLGIECIVLNAEALAGQDADALGEGVSPLFAALLTAADKLGMQYVATPHRARVETASDGVHTVCPPAGGQTVCTPSEAVSTRARWGVATYCIPSLSAAVSRAANSGLTPSPSASASCPARASAFSTMHSMPSFSAACLAASASAACSAASRTAAPATAKPCCCRMRTATAQAAVSAIWIRTLSWLS